MTEGRAVQGHIARMAGYVPGEQPRDGGFTKLNTNENPYPPSPRVLEAIARALDDRLRLYPDPVGHAFRVAAARLHGVEPANILCGNGSDDLLTIVTRACAGPGDVVVYPTPSYILYRTLAELQAARPVEVPFEADWSLDPARFAVPGARLAFLANPNSPSGTALRPDAVGRLARALDCPLVVDEAYVSFADSDCVGLVAEHPNVIVLRTLSKGYSLAGLRFGYGIARPELVEEFIKVKDSYNCDTLSLVGATAAIEDRDYQAETRAKVLATRRRLTQAMREFGYDVPDSQANFVWCTGGPAAAPVYEALKARKILVRLMRYPGHADGLRITVGTDAEIDRLLEALGEILGNGR
ncbi:MAG TPA: histidinol-phosphate transaminase [Isosphaeraceae bacterium]|jgi:histidinol-phosphate aminotransferase|nr:histidinol-phosphate transaminase [Isosphaeraceae bacterium]